MEGGKSGEGRGIEGAAGRAGLSRRRCEEPVRIDDERGEMWCSSSILSFRRLERK